MSRLSNRLRRLPGSVLRLVLALGGLLVVATIVLCGAALALGLYALARLRGRPGGLHFAWRGPLGAAARGWPGSASRPTHAPGEVVDVEVREIGTAGPELLRRNER